MEIQKIIYYFIIGSICGFYIESLYKILSDKIDVSIGMFNGPYCILYGVSTVVISIFLCRSSGGIFETFIQCFFILSFLEYITYNILEKVYDIKLWDYSNENMNIYGKVCLKSSLYRGAIGTIYIKYMYPIFESIRIGANQIFISSAITIMFTIIVLDVLSTSALSILEKKI